jgi:RNA polymerase sigma-70 factor (ECF subfamily)
LLMFAHCRFIDRWRRLQSNRYYDSETYDEVSEALEAAHQRTFPFLPAEMLYLVEEALQRIKPQQRRTIELVYYSGMTAEEISKTTGESVRVVRHNLYRGLEKMRSILGCVPSAPIPRDVREPSGALHERA